MECLHRNKLKRRIAAKLVEHKRQEDEKTNPHGNNGGGHH
jgi:hypothetical protein